MSSKKSPPILAANWKMNGDFRTIDRLLNDLKNDLLDEEMDLGQKVVVP